MGTQHKQAKTSKSPASFFVGKGFAYKMKRTQTLKQAKNSKHISYKHILSNKNDRARNSLYPWPACHPSKDGCNISEHKRLLDQKSTKERNNRNNIARSINLGDFRVVLTCRERSSGQSTDNRNYTMSSGGQWSSVTNLLTTAATTICRTDIIWYTRKARKETEQSFSSLMNFE